MILFTWKGPFPPLPTCPMLPIIYSQAIRNSKNSYAQTNTGYLLLIETFTKSLGNTPGLVPIDADKK